MNLNPNTSQPSEGEQFLIDFFNSAGIKYEREKRIDRLKNDTKQYRIADFYLPKYKVYVEFFGLWNNNGNEIYRDKKEVYKLNNIPCVYLYPENLGIIGYVFDKRLQVVLAQHDMKKELKRYRLYKLWAGELITRISILFFCSMALLMTFSIVGAPSMDWRVIALITGVASYQATHLCKLYMNIFKRNRYSLNSL